MGKKKKENYPYLIEFRFHGYARKYAKTVAFDLAKKFNVRGVTRKKVVPHITLYGPFKTSNYRMAASRVQRVAKKYDLVPFKLKGFNCFNGDKNKVIYLDIEPSAELKDLRYDLAQELRKVTTTKSSQDRRGRDDFKFHTTVAFKDIDKKFPKMWKYINKLEEPDINQHIVRITILRKRRILYEYDLMHRRLLNRKQSLNREIKRQTFEILKKKMRKVYGTTVEKKRVVRKIVRKKSLWEKIKSIFK